MNKFIVFFVSLMLITFNINKTEATLKDYRFVNNQSVIKMAFNDLKKNVKSHDDWYKDKLELNLSKVIAVRAIEEIDLDSQIVIIIPVMKKNNDIIGEFWIRYNVKNRELFNDKDFIDYFLIKDSINSDYLEFDQNFWYNPVRLEFPDSEINPSRYFDKDNLINHLSNSLKGYDTCSMEYFLTDEFCPKICLLCRCKDSKEIKIDLS